MLCEHNTNALGSTHRPMEQAMVSISNKVLLYLRTFQPRPHLPTLNIGLHPFTLQRQHPHTARAQDSIATAPAQARVIHPYK